MSRPLMLAVLLTLLPLRAALALSADECAVWARETAFNKSVEDHDTTAFAAFLNPNAVFGAASARTTRGRDAVVKSWANILEGKDIKIVWRPRFISIGGDPDVAISRGPAFFETRAADGKVSYATGLYTTVWTRTGADAPWLVLFDGGGGLPSPAASREEGLAHLATAPAICPRD